MKTKTRYQLHVERWGGCTACPLCRTRTRVVLCRGKLPCDVLFVGEAPGRSEDVLGLPFVGPAGMLLNQILANSIPAGVRVAFTNLVACIPLGDGNEKTEAPDPGSVEACAPRLQELLDMASPDLVFLVGSEADKYLNPKYKNWVTMPRVPAVRIDHPAYLARLNHAQQGLAIRRCETVIAREVEKMLERKDVWSNGGGHAAGG